MSNYIQILIPEKKTHKKQMLIKSQDSISLD